MFLEVMLILLGVILPLLVKKWKDGDDGSDFRLADLSKILSIAVVMWPFYYFAKKLYSPPWENLFVPNVILDIIMALLLFIYVVKLSPLKQKGTWKILVKAPGEETRLLRIIAVLLFIIATTFFGWRTVSMNPQKLLREDFVSLIAVYENIMLIGILLPVYVISAASEELVYRYFSIHSLKQFFSKKVSLIMSALIFTLLHGNISFDVFFIGLFLGYLYYETGSLLFCVLIHVMRNVFVTASSFYVFYKDIGSMTVTTAQFFLIALLFQLLYFFAVELAFVKVGKMQSV
jgi:membrane protease YdiL (CAAX protease family)